MCGCAVGSQTAHGSRPAVTRRADIQRSPAYLAAAWPPPTLATCECTAATASSSPGCVCAATHSGRPQSAPCKLAILQQKEDPGPCQTELPATQAPLWPAVNCCCRQRSILLACNCSTGARLRLLLLLLTGWAWVSRGARRCCRGLLRTSGRCTSPASAAAWRQRCGSARHPVQAAHTNTVCT